MLFVANLMVNAASELEELFDFEAQRSVQHDSLHYALPLNKTISHPLHHAGEGERDERLWSIDHEAFLMTLWRYKTRPGPRPRLEPRPKPGPRRRS